MAQALGDVGSVGAFGELGWRLSDNWSAIARGELGLNWGPALPAPALGWRALAGLKGRW